MTAAGEMDVRHVANLARLALSPDEEARYAREMEAILAYVRQLQAVDVAGIEPTAHATRITNVLVDDTPRPCPPREPLLANAPDLTTDGQVRVPVVIGAVEDTP